VGFLMARAQVTDQLATPDPNLKMCILVYFFRLAGDDAGMTTSTRHGRN
jgi:hypothetical protein